VKCFGINKFVNLNLKLKTYGPVWRIYIVDFFVYCWSFHNHFREFYRHFAPDRPKLWWLSRMSNGWPTGFWVDGWLLVTPCTRFFTEFLPPSIKSSNPFDKFLTCQNVFNGLLSTSRNDFVRVFCLHAYLLRRSEYYLFVVSADLAYLGSEYYLFVVFTNLAYLFLDTLFLIYTHSWPYC